MSNIAIGTKVRDNGQGYPIVIGTEQIGEVVEPPFGASTEYIWVHFEYDADTGERFDEDADDPTLRAVWPYIESELVVVE